MAVEGFQTRPNVFLYGEARSAFVAANVSLPTMRAVVAWCEREFTELSFGED